VGRLWRIALTLLGIAGLARTGSAAEQIPIRIVFDKRAVCSNSDEVYLAIQSRSDRVRRANEGERAFGIRVRLKRVGANVRGELSVIHEQGETNPRAVEGASCEVVVDALSLTAALALDAVVAEGAQAADASQTASDAAESKASRLCCTCCTQAGEPDPCGSVPSGQCGNVPSDCSHCGAPEPRGLPKSQPKR